MWISWFQKLLFKFNVLYRYVEGLRARPSRAAAAAAAGSPVEPLELWTYESSPFTKAVRESLTELAIPHVVRYCPR
jgi:hypothetical protein